MDQAESTMDYSDAELPEKITQACALLGVWPSASNDQISANYRWLLNQLREHLPIWNLTPDTQEAHLQEAYHILQSHSPGERMKMHQEFLKHEILLAIAPHVEASLSRSLAFSGPRVPSGYSGDQTA